MAYELLSQRRFFEKKKAGGTFIRDLRVCIYIYMSLYICIYIYIYLLFDHLTVYITVMILAVVPTIFFKTLVVYFLFHSVSHR